MRLIDADELKKCAIPCELNNGALTELCVPLYQINNAPTVDVIPTELHEKIMDMTTGELLECQSHLRPQGEWIFNKEMSVTCSLWNCSVCNRLNGNNSFNFCPNCGADMRGKQP